MPHFDSAGRHADDYDVRSMWISCRHDPDSRTMVQYDPYTDRWNLYGIYDIDYPTPEEVIAAAKRLTAAGCRYRRRGGPPDQDPIPIRERYDAAIRQFHAAALPDNAPAQPFGTPVRQARLALEQTEDRYRAQTERLERANQGDGIYPTPEAERIRQDHHRSRYALRKALTDLSKAADLPYCVAPGCYREPVPDVSSQHPHGYCPAHAAPT